MSQDWELDSQGDSALKCEMKCSADDNCKGFEYTESEYKCRIWKVKPIHCLPYQFDSETDLCTFTDNEELKESYKDGNVICSIKNELGLKECNAFDFFNKINWI